MITSVCNLCLFMCRCFASFSGTDGFEADLDESQEGCMFILFRSCLYVAIYCLVRLSCTYCTVHNT